MNMKQILVAGAIGGLLLVGFLVSRPSPTLEAIENNTSQDKDQKMVSLIGHSDGQLKFIDFGFMLPPSEYQGRVFQLSQDFPKAEPPLDDEINKILQIDFKEDWRGYLEAVRDYVYAGNATTDYENSFFLIDNPVRPWYHVPWQHWGPTGREGFHGLTQEGPIEAQMLAQPQTDGTSHAYAVGFYNAPGGYAIGQVWPDTTAPDFSYFASGEGFPVGTVVAKVLFTTFDASQVPYLTNPLSWNAYVYESDLPDKDPGSDPSKRVQAKVNLIQMDLMIRDPRAVETGGWVFGNYVYNGNQEKENRWLNMVPLGIQWGNDPKELFSYTNPTPTKTKINPKLKETIINPNESELPPVHLGWSGRLNGPVDSTASSCMSCHSTAEYPVKSAILPFINDPEVPIPKEGSDAPPSWMRWFRNLDCGTPFDKEAVSLDYSLQLAKSVQNYIEWRDGSEKGRYALEYGTPGYKVRRNVRK